MYHNFITFLVTTDVKYYVYAISSQIRNYIYVGLTYNLDRRINDHNSGYNKTTKPYKPFTIIYTKEFITRLQAREQEKYQKSSVRKRFLRKLRAG